ncbi:MAG: hypothetical protein ACJ76X_14605 [Solirubrobacteraceae bacterium]
MRHLRTLTALAATSALALAAAPAAMAKTSGVGNSNGNATMNICVFQQDCTYINYKNGKPTDVVHHTGTLTNWSLSAGSVGGQVKLRVLRPVSGGKFKAVHSSAVQTVTQIGLNTYSAHIRVKAGDVLALSNATSGIYMATAAPDHSIHYFSSTLADGSTGKPDATAPSLHLLLSAHVKY